MATVVRQYEAVFQLKPTTIFLRYRHSQSQKPAECVMVVVRCRPLLPKEKAKGYEKYVLCKTGRDRHLFP